jgi:ATP-dependent helicase HrpA
LPLLNQLSQTDFDKLIPGYLPEKVEHLIRSLPKAIRKQLAPLSDTITAINHDLRDDTQPLLQAMANSINARSGLNLTPSDFNLAALPEHLNMKLVLVDEQGDEIARADTLSTLCDRFGHQASEVVAEVEHHWQQYGLTSWSFGSLPERVEIKTHDLVTLAYPALVDAGNCVDLQLFDHPEEAEKSHHTGVTRLLQIGSQFGKTLAKCPLPYWQEIGLRYSPIGSQHDLRSALLDALISHLVFADGRSIRSEEDFKRAVDVIEQQFSEAVQPYCRALMQALNAYGQCLNVVESLPVQLSRDDIQTQLDYLIYEDFLTEVPLDILLQYPVYFKALDARIERLDYDPQGDLKKLALLAPYWNRYLQNWQAHPENSALEYYRWQVEAYRVSLFAPKVKSPVPISPKRLDKTWQAFELSR